MKKFLFEHTFVNDLALFDIVWFQKVLFMDERYPKLCPMQYFFSFYLCIYFVFAFDAVLDSFKKSLN